MSENFVPRYIPVGSLFLQNSVAGYRDPFLLSNADPFVGDFVFEI
jgi:hypothetical protein